MVNYNSTSSYFKTVPDYDVLDKEREQELFKLYKEENNLKARNIIILSNIRFVFKVALRYKNQPLPFRDLFNEGIIGLIRATTTYDYTRNLRFISYAVWWIRAYCNRAINEKSNIVKQPQRTTLKEREKKKEEKPEDFEYYTSIFNDHLLNNNDELINNDENDITNSIEKEKLYKIIKVFFNDLSEKEVYILKNVFGLEGHEMTLEDIRIKINLSKERVRQLKEKALIKLRKKYKKYYGREITFS